MADALLYEKTPDEALEQETTVDSRTTRNAGFPVVWGPFPERNDDLIPGTERNDDLIPVPVPERQQMEKTPVRVLAPHERVVPIGMCIVRV